MGDPPVAPAGWADAQVCPYRERRLSSAEMHAEVCVPGKCILRYALPDTLKRALPVAAIVWSFPEFFVICTPNSKPDDTITAMRAGVAGDKELTRRAAARLCGKAVRQGCAARLCGKAVRYYHPIRD